MKTVFTVCIKEGGSLVYVYSTWEAAQKASSAYEKAYGTVCEVFEEELKT